MDALKKLERDRETTGQVVVVATTSAATVRARFLQFVAAAVIVCALAAASAWGVWRLLSAPQAVGGTPRPPESPPSPRASAALPPPIWETAAAPRPAPPPGTATRAPRGPATAPPGVIAPANVSPAPELHLEAISSQDGVPVAVINGQLVREGEDVDGARVLRIGADHVELDVQGKRRVIGF